MSSEDAKEESVDAEVDADKMDGTSTELANEEVKHAASSPIESIEKVTPSQAPSPRDSKDDEVFKSEVEALNKAISSMSGKAARTATRQNWRKCMIGGKDDDSKKDQSFLVRALMKAGDPYVLRRAMDEHGEQLLANASERVLQRLMQTHGDKLLAAASPEMLDSAIKMRLPSINGKDLVKMLSEADRLGFNEEDLIDEDDENVGVMPVEAMQMGTMPRTAIPSRLPERPDNYDSGSDVMEIDPPPGLRAPTAVALQEPAAQLYLPRGSHPPAGTMPPSGSPQMVLTTRSKEPNHVPGSKHICPDCGGSFTQSAGLRYHMANKVCQKPKVGLPPEQKWKCENCGKAFANPRGFAYHKEHAVCKSHGTAKATPPTHAHPPATYVAPEQDPRRVIEHSYYTNGAPVSNGNPIYSNSQNGSAAQHPAQPLPPRQPLPSHPQQPLPPPAYYGPPPHPPQFTLPSQSYPPQYHGAYPPHNHLPPHVQQSQYKPIEKPNPIVNIPHQGPDFRVTTGNPATANQTPARQPLPTNSTPSNGPQLDPQAFAEMSAKLDKEQERYERKLKEIPENLTAVDRDEEIQKIRRGHATRKSMIRKAYGIQVRRSKLRPANAVTTPDGGLDMSRVVAPGSATPASTVTPGSGFAPINRLDSFRAQPATTPSGSVTRQRLPSVPSSQGRPGELLESNDPKRRRYDDSSDSSVQYVGERTPGTGTSSAPPSTERERQPLPSEPLVDSAVTARVTDIAERDTQSRDIDSPAEPSRPTSASSNSSTAEKSTSEEKRQRVPIGTAQKQWQASRRESTSQNGLGQASPTSVSSSASEVEAEVEGKEEGEARAVQAQKLAQVEAISLNDTESSSDTDEDILSRLPSKSRSQSASESTELKIKVARGDPLGTSRTRSRGLASKISGKSTRATAKA